MTPTPTPTATATPRAGFDVIELQRRVNEILSDKSGFYAVVISTPDQHRIYEVGTNTQVDAASLYKLAIMVEVFKQRRDGSLSFDDTIYMEPGYFEFNDEFDPIDESFIGTELSIDYLLNEMITKSSNAAAIALLYRVNADNINQTLQELGLTGTVVLYTPDPNAPEPTPADGQGTPPPSIADADSVTTASDMDSLFAGMLRGTVVDPQSSLEMLALLSGQMINDRLPARLPEGTPVAHKTGNLPGVVHDAGVIYTSNGPVVVSVLTVGADEGEAVDAMASIGELVYWMNFGTS